VNGGIVASGPAVGGADNSAIPMKPIGEVRWRDVCAIAGRVRSLRVQPWANVPTLEAVVVDDTGGLLLVFLGRRSIAGLDLGRRLVASGRVGQHRGYLAMLNPLFELRS
jgi:RecG-like helicase